MLKRLISFFARTDPTLDCSWWFTNHQTNKTCTFVKVSISKSAETWSYMGTSVATVCSTSPWTCWMLYNPWLAGFTQTVEPWSLLSPVIRQLLWSCNHFAWQLRDMTEVGRLQPHLSHIPPWFFHHRDDEKMFCCQLGMVCEKTWKHGYVGQNTSLMHLLCFPQMNLCCMAD